MFHRIDYIKLIHPSVFVLKDFTYEKFVKLLSFELVGWRWSLVSVSEAKVLADSIIGSAFFD